MKFQKKSSTAPCRAALSNDTSNTQYNTRGTTTDQAEDWGLVRIVQGLLIASCFGAVHAQTSVPETPRYPAASDSASRSTAATDVFVASAPDTYTVVRGDTLWGIAGRFLQQPWRWPQIWQMNREQIRNPHWIYPGQVIVLDRTTGTMRLGSGPGANGTVKLSPQVRVETGKDAIPSIAPEVIAPYLTQPLIVETATMRDAPRIVASREHVVLGAGDIAYVAGITDPSITNYQLFRPGRALKDPETGAVIAYQSDFLGTAQLTRPGTPATVSITSSKMEINAGDRLVAVSKPLALNYMPHAPAGPLAGRIISTYAGVAYAGVNMVVAINRGTANGVDVGTVLAIKSFGRTIVDRTNGTKEVMTLPEERKGLLFVFRVFDGVSYGLITSSAGPVEVGDAVTQP